MCHDLQVGLMREWCEYGIIDRICEAMSFGIPGIRDLEMIKLRSGLEIRMEEEGGGGVVMAAACKHEWQQFISMLLLIKELYFMAMKTFVGKCSGDCLFWI
ncbi:hypothetical protein NC652_014693 [Populus alba x Populus x berolinensis]|nr:hypothetical protein NC651_014266 [Populus alba x Populus x berolinensis]KAJ6931278.1 hypothetical protein NC652_014693 [Populus alba x Populus x berolinensis]